MAPAQPPANRQVNDTILRVDALSKSFAGIRALDDICIEVRSHEVVGVVGQNGAGKSTLLKVLAGVCQPDCGHIVLRGKPVRFGCVAEAARAGIGMVFQELSLLPNLSVAENILLGHEDAALHAGFYDWRALRALAQTQLDKLGSSLSPSAQTETLSFAERQIVELAKVLAIEERTQHEPVILLDEPTSMLDSGQLETVLMQIERLRTRAAVVFVSHRLDDVLRVCDRVYVLTDGRCVAARDRENCTIAELQDLMLARDLGVEYTEQMTPAPANRSAVRLSVRGLSRANSYRAVSFELRAGEVLGIAGVGGSGRESLCRTLFGAEEPERGEIALNGRPIQLGEPADAIRLGIGYVPAERRVEGVVAGLSMRENMTLAHVDWLRRGPFIDLTRERALVRSWIDRLRIKPRNPETLADQLSGGNQQKLLLAKCLIARKPQVLILDQPLRGLDVGSKADVTLLIRELAWEGIAVVLIADSFDELIALSDSILVMKDGIVSGRFPASAAKPSEGQILARMV
jgi:ribose transport system ATP-binding protein